MIVKLEEFSKALEKGLNPSKFLFLLVKQDGAEYLCNDFLSNEEEISLITNGYITGNLTLTQKAKDLLKEIEGDKGVSNKIDYKALYTKLQNKLIELTGKKQKVLQNKYSFLPNYEDFSTKLAKTVSKYNLKDNDLVEKCLIRHIETSHASKWEYAKLIDYFISKNGSSDLTSIYENWESICSKEENTQKEIITNTKELF